MPEKTDDEISLKEIILKVKDWKHYIFSKSKTIAFAGIIGGVFGLTYSFFKKPVYTATLSFALEDEKNGGGLSGALGLASQFGFDMGGNAGGAFSEANLIELMKSRNLVEKSLLNPILINKKKISLAEAYIDFNDLRKGWKDNPSLANIQFLPNSKRSNFTIQHDSILGAIYENLTKENLIISQSDKKVSIINIMVKSENELFSKYFTEALAREVSDFYIETKSKKAKLNLDILSKQTDSVRSELNAAITGVATANDNTFNLNPSLNINRVPSVKRQVDVQANTAILTELVKNLEMAKVTLRKETPLIQVIDAPILPLKKERLGKFKGLVLGGIIGGLLCILFLSGSRLWEKIMEIE